MTAEPGQERDGRVDGTPSRSPRRDRTLTVAGLVLAAAAVYVPPLGAVGMVLGALAHVGGYRPGLYAAAAAAGGTVLGTVLVFLTG